MAELQKGIAERESGAVAERPARAELLIRGTGVERWRELWRYRELAFFLVWRDVKLRYKQTVLGAAWAILQPLLSMGIFTVLFGLFAKLPSDGVPYPVFYFAGLLPWTYLSQTVAQAGNSLLANAQLVTKVYFPRLLLPAAPAVAALFDAAIASSVLLILLLIFGPGIGPRLVLLPLLMVPLIAAAFGAGLLLSALNVAFRDVKHTIPFLLQSWMFASPVVYPLSLVPERWRVLYSLNPAAGSIEAFRSVAVGGSFPTVPFMVSTTSAACLLAVGLRYFNRTERNFADLI